MELKTTFSKCRKYRYLLMRQWASGPRVMFVGLNPSTADEMRDDPTIRRCINYAKAWGAGSLVMTNIFTLRATNPKVMLAHPEPNGSNINIADNWLDIAASLSKIVVAAWGTHGMHLGRSKRVCDLLGPRKRLYVLGLTKHGHPKHPLYLPKHLEPVRWTM